MFNFYAFSDYVVNHSTDVVAFVMSVLAFVIALRNRRESRVIYNVEKIVLRTDTIEKIQQKLQSGQYTVLSVSTQGAYPNEVTNILLGRIKK